MNMLDWSSLEKAVSALQLTLTVYSKHNQKDENLNRLMKSGVIQHFEFTYELSWKFMKRWLGDALGKSAVDGLSRQGLFRLAAEYKLIDSIEQWMLFHRARNETSHTYDENTAEEVFHTAQAFLPYAESLLERLKSKN